LDKKLSTSDTQEKILEAARSVFMRDGYHGARMQEIADAAGINKALLHYYFKSKDRLFERIFTEAFTSFIPRVYEIFLGPATVIEKLEAYVDAYLLLLQERPYLPAFIFQEMNRDADRLFSMLFSGMQGPLPFAALFRQAADEMAVGRLRHMDPREILINTMALCVFPYIARPMMQRFLLGSDAEYKLMLEQRRRSVKTFLRNALLP
jgi:AcrR family transcriptional regulator